MFDLIEATGRGTSGGIPLIADVTVFQGFAVVERGEMDSAELTEFELENYISRHPRTSKNTSRLSRTLRKFMK